MLVSSAQILAVNVVLIGSTCMPYLGGYLVHRRCSLALYVLAQPEF